MANPNQDNRSVHRVEDEARRNVERNTEQMKLVGQAATKASEEIARSGADILQQNAELLQKSFNFGTEMATELLNHSREYFGRSLGVSGDEAQKATDRSAHNAQTIIYSATTVAKGVNGASQEYFDFMRKQLEKNMARMNDLWRCRSPQDVAAIQTDLVREAVNDLFERNRRIADMSVRLADEARNHIAEASKRAA